VQRLGTAELTRVDVRVVPASNVDLAGRAGRGEFREDLFYRLAAFPLELPPLSERRIDIIPLVACRSEFVTADAAGDAVDARMLLLSEQGFASVSVTTDAESGNGCSAQATSGKFLPDGSRKWARGARC